MDYLISLTTISTELAKQPHMISHISLLLFPPSYIIETLNCVDNLIFNSSKQSHFISLYETCYLGSYNINRNFYNRNEIMQILQNAVTNILKF